MGNIQRDEVMKVTSQIASVIIRLEQIGKLPQDIATTLITIMQTSSVDDFTKVFAGIEVKKKLYDIKQSYNVYIKCFNYVNTSGKTGAQIPHLPLGDDSSPRGR
jgi:hypothetical protein